MFWKSLQTCTCRTAWRRLCSQRSSEGWLYACDAGERVSCDFQLHSSPAGCHQASTGSKVTVSAAGLLAPPVLWAPPHGLPSLTLPSARYCPGVLGGSLAGLGVRVGDRLSGLHVSTFLASNTSGRLFWSVRKQHFFSWVIEQIEALLAWCYPASTRQNLCRLQLIHQTFFFRWAT